MRELILHIGAHRTATTAIQKTLRKNFNALLERGVLYPYGVNRHEKIANRLLRGAKSAADLAADLDRRANAWEEKLGHAIGTIVMSDEDICTRRDLSILAALREYFDVRIVFALRRQDLWLESWYLQNVKGQWNKSLAHLTFAQFMNRREEFHWIDYNRYVRHLDDVFGAENVRLHVFERSAMPEGPVIRFCRQAGIAEPEKLAAVTETNNSLNPLVSEFMRQLPLDSAPPKYRSMLVGACGHVNREMKGKEHPSRLLTPERRREVLARYADGNAALARRRFDREALFLDPLPPADAPVADMRLPASSEELMERFVQPFVAALIDQQRN